MGDHWNSVKSNKIQRKSRFWTLSGFRFLRISSICLEFFHFALKNLENSWKSSKILENLIRAGSGPSRISRICTIRLRLARSPLAGQFPPILENRRLRKIRQKLISCISRNDIITERFRSGSFHVHQKFWRFDNFSHPNEHLDCRIWRKPIKDQPAPCLCHWAQTIKN